MTPNYSILLCNQPYAEYRDKIEKWLLQGIKVLWFSEKESEIEALKQKYEAYAGLFLFLAYKVSFAEQRVVVDGEEKDGFVAGVLADACPLFNAAQYLVEHCSAREHIIVQASAGTGKTTVMVDRILYLLHTQPELRMSEIYMITFTNDAANEMKQRLQKTLMGRYRLTRSLRYLRWLEELPQIHISTIHSFAYDMLKQYGIGAGFTAGLSIKSLEYERGELLREVLDEQLDSTMGIREQIGLPYYRAKSVAEEFWAAFSKLGVSSGEVKKMDWGQPSDISSEGFQNVMERMTGRLDDRYFDRKSKEEAIGVEDIMRDLQDILEEGILPSPDISMKYLFIDEFQDSDLAQIHVACQMVQLLDARFFVVGDVKQSIYRFRGATDQAFELLQKKMKENGIPPAKKFTLKNNYRTSAEVMETLDECFAVWDEMGLLQYESSVIPFNHARGRMRLIRGEDKERLNRQIVCAVSEELESLMEQIAREKIQPTEKTRVVVLTRSNTDLLRVADLLKKNRIPVSVRTDGSFYTSAAVRDFYTMIISFLFCEEPKAIFNYLLTPYAGETGAMDLNEMEWMYGDRQRLTSCLIPFLEETQWGKYHREFRLRPVLAVLGEMLDESSVVDYYVAQEKSKRRSEGKKEQQCNAAAFAAGRQYQANLDKLMEILQSNLSGDGADLYDIYQFLKLNIASNRTETEAVWDDGDDYSSVLCMTVHRSKGLEFDTVILPYTNRTFPGGEQTELLIDPEERKVGWNYTGKGKKKNRYQTSSSMQNSYYAEMKEKETMCAAKEETRILYVAMTRAIRNLTCIVPESKNERTWAYLLEETGVDYE